MADLRKRCLEVLGRGPWARGAYTLYRPGQLSGGISAVMARPEGRIHFAGEHLSPYPSWMQAAILAGHRAAAQVNAEGALET